MKCKYVTLDCSGIHHMSVSNDCNRVDFYNTVKDLPDRKFSSWVDINNDALLYLLTVPEEDATMLMLKFDKIRMHSG